MRRMCTYILIAMMLSLTSVANALSLKPHAPTTYTIKKGDSIWLIANKFLKKPWQWRKLLENNPQIKNPSRLYPGDIIELRYNKKKPYLKVRKSNTVYLTPKVRAVEFHAIPPIPLGNLQPFLNSSVVLEKNSFKRSPYVVAYKNERLIGGQGDEVYVKNLHPKDDTISYAIYRFAKTYKKCDRILGFKGEFIGYGELNQKSEPAVLLITSIASGVRINDKVLPNIYPAFDLYFTPQEPAVNVKGKILDLLGDTYIGSAGYAIVIDLGQADGLKNGDVVGLYSKQQIVADPNCPKKPIIIPPKRLGEAMIYRTFCKVSYALILRATSSIRTQYNVFNP